MSATKSILAAGAAEAAVTGLVLIGSPAIFARLILSVRLDESGQALGRIAGVAMLALGLACWPGRTSASQPASALRVLLLYNLLATAYLLYLAIGGRFAGVLLWPAIALHALLSILAAAFGALRSHPGIDPDNGHA